MEHSIERLNLQLFAEGGDGGGDGAATTGENSPVAGEARLRELGVPEHVLAKRAKRGNVAKAAAPQAAEPQAAAETEPTAAQQAAAADDPTPEGSTTDGTAEGTSAPARMSWEEIMADPDYNKQMQATMQARLKSAKGAEESLSKLKPAIELLARKYGMDAENLDAAALADAISDDDDYYEERALEMGVPVDTAKRIDQMERENARRQAEDARNEEEQRIHQHIAKLQQQGEELKKTFRNFDLATELQNPAFARMTSPGVGISVEDAYYACHRKEIQTAAMQATAKKTAQQMANAVRSGSLRPNESGTRGQAPSTTTFNYATASKEQREALKRRIAEAAARGEKLYPGQF